jgi:hypothetical protein
MSVADLAYAQQILDETFDDIWTSPADYEFELESAIPAWALEAWRWPRENPDEGEHDIGELVDCVIDLTPGGSGAKDRHTST